MADTSANQANRVGNQQPENTEYMYGDAGYSLTAALGAMDSAVGSYTGTPTAGSDAIVNQVVDKITAGAGGAAAGGTNQAGAAGATNRAGTAGGTTAGGTTTGGTSDTSNMQDQAGITKK